MLRVAADSPDREAVLRRGLQALDRIRDWDPIYFGELSTIYSRYRAALGAKEGT